MRPARRALAALLSSLALLSTPGCGGQQLVWPDDSATASYAVPLVLAWRPARPLVELSIDGSPPLLALIDTGADRSALPERLAARLGLPRVGDPTRGARVRAGTVVLDPEGRAPVAVGGARFAVLGLDRFGEVYGRPVEVRLGADWVAGRALVHDPDAGVLRFAPSGAEAEPQHAVVELDDAGQGWSAPVTVGGVELELRVASGATASGLSPSATEAVREKVGRVDPAELGIGAATPWPARWLAADDAPYADGWLGFTALVDHGWRLDAGTRLLHVWPARGGAARFARFPEVPDCGERMQRCLSGVIDRVRGGVVELRFERPEVHVSTDYWLRVDLGVPGRPFTVLVQLRPRPAVAESAGALTAQVEDPRLVPGRVRPEGAPIDVVDLVPAERPCPGVVCIQRQEGDSADALVESSLWRPRIGAWLPARRSTPLDAR